MEAEHEEQQCRRKRLCHDKVTRLTPARLHIIIVAGDFMSLTRGRYITDFQKEHYDRIVLSVPKGYKEELQEYAQANDLSLNALILKAIERQYDFDFSKKKRIPKPKREP